MSYEITVNGKPVEVDVDADTPLLWVLRDELGLKGTKFGCGVADCGACTVIVDGRARRSCRLQIGRADGSEIETIEGLSLDGTHPLQLAWIAEQVPQCGYCQSGMLMTTAKGIIDQLIAATRRQATIDGTYRGVLSGVRVVVWSCARVFMPSYSCILLQDNSK